VLDALDDVAASQASGAALDATAAAHGLKLEGQARADAVAYFDQLRGVACGAYAQGFTVRQGSETQLDLTPGR